MLRAGQGQPFLYLHDTNGPEGWTPFLEALAESHDVWAPSHPGYGVSSHSSDITSVEDLALFYLKWLELFDLRRVVVAGSGLGGWIAAEMAVWNCSRIERLVLMDAIGIKVSPADVPDIADTQTMHWEEKIRLEWYRPAASHAYFPHPSELSEDKLAQHLKNEESTVRYTWKPFMHNPKLRSSLKLVHIPVQVLWGEADGVVTPAYGQAYADSFPQATFTLIPQAGHFPHLEQPDRVIQEIFHGSPQVASRT
ncbi:MAG: alpha/beta hydrolase [Alicyclobacillus sp.]|nr:alpha/beta hydrolase [Alicyclobacillus sp.]